MKLKKRIKLALQFHPDKNKANNAHETFVEITKCKIEYYK